MNANDLGTVEFNQVRLTLRADLSFALQNFSGQDCYVIEDQANSKYFRIGIAEYTFISLLDGKTTVAKAIAATAEKLGRDAFIDEDAAAICKWLIDSGLATTPDSAGGERLIDAATTARNRRRTQWLNPLMIRVPMSCPEPLFRALHPAIRLFSGFPFLLVWIATLVIAVYHLSVHWNRTSGASAQVLSRDNWLWLAVSWLGLKLLHELFHGFFCKRFGGRVRECGILFVLFVPMPYVDVTSCWRFPSKWQRIAAAAAGMYLEMFIAALAAIVWCRSDVGLVSHHAFNIMVLGSVTTLFFNANPLMRFDGYYILADWLEIPNLYARGQQYLSFLMRKHVLGVPLTPPTWRAPKRTFVKAYGFASFGWRVVVCVGLVIAAESLFLGAGIALAALSIILWFAVPAWKFVKYVLFGRGREKPKRMRFVFVTSIVGGLLYLALAKIPWLSGQQAPAVVDYRDAKVIRVGVAGFVRELGVQPGSRVSSGDVVARLENPDLQAAIDDLRLAIRQTDLRARHFRSSEDISAEQIEFQTRVALEQRLAERQRQAEQLIVKAPIDGIVIADELPFLLGSYLEEGGELMTIADESRKELRVSIAQEDIDRFRAAGKRVLKVRLDGRALESFQLALHDIEPQADTLVPHAALAATGGGPLPVRDRRVSTETDQQRGDQKWELLSPRFLATAVLDREQSRGVKVGQTGSITLRDNRDSIGAYFYHELRRWIRDRLRNDLLN